MNKDEIKDAFVALIAEEASVSVCSTYASRNIVYVKGVVENLRVFYSLLKISNLSDATLEADLYCSDEVEKTMRVTYAKEGYDFIKGKEVIEAIYTHPAPF